MDVSEKIVKSGNFHTIFNAVDLEKFAYNPSLREEVRKELKLENKFVVGHAGNFVYQKNHYFLIDVFEALKKILSPGCAAACGNRRTI